MKKYTTTIVLLLTLGVFAFLTHSTSEAQEISGLEKLAEAINRAVDSFSSTPKIEPEGLTLQSSTHMVDCFDDISSLPSSNKYKGDSDWSLNLIPRENIGSNNLYPARTQFTDINGDGLIDILYIRSHSYSSFKHLKTCVLLNTGKGWERAYICSGLYDSPEEDVFYGDCADMTP